MTRLGGGAVVVVACVLGVGAAPAGAQSNPSIVVDKTADTSGGACTVAADDCTLRDAITKANADAGLDTINFTIPGAGVHKITLANALPSVSGETVIDGYSQPGATANTNAGFTSAFAAGGAGSNAAPKIELDLNDKTGLVLAGGNSSVRGL